VHPNHRRRALAIAGAPYPSPVRSTVGVHHA
jgi:hypothetical protein